MASLTVRQPTAHGSFVMTDDETGAVIRPPAGETWSYRQACREAERRTRPYRPAKALCVCGGVIGGGILPCRCGDPTPREG